jgi:hypothetical protein
MPLKVAGDLPPTGKWLELKGRSAPALSRDQATASAAAVKMQIALTRKAVISNMPHVSSPGIVASLELPARYHYEPACHAGDCGNEQDHFRYRQNPIGTHLRLNCWTNHTYPSNSVGLKR